MSCGSPANLGSDAMPMPPAAFTALVRKEMTGSAVAIEAAGITPQ
jgi:hypothetical protein